MQKTSPTLRLVGKVITACLYLYRPVGDFITDPAFSQAFSHDSTTSATNPRVIGLVAGSDPVEHLHKAQICIQYFFPTSTLILLYS